MNAYEQAAARIAAMPELEPYRDAILYGWHKGAAHYEWVATCELAELLSWAQAVAQATDERVILFAPLGVAFQTVEEAKKWGIGGVAYAKDHESARSQIVVTNYDRRDNFD